MTLQAIKDFCQKQWQAGKIIDMQCTYPTFQIDTPTFKKAVLNEVIDKVRFGLLTNKYKNEQFISDMSYEDLLEAQTAKSQNKETTQQKGMNLYCEKILSVMIERDSNLDSRQLNISSLNSLCSDLMLIKLSELEHMRTFSAPYGELQSKFQVEQDKFAATMIMLKQQLPNVYKSIHFSMDDSFYKDTVSAVKSKEQKPNSAVIQHIMDSDNELCMRLFPKHYKELQSHKTQDFKF